ncbi:putative 1,4-beta-D-xylan synthase [Helianthus annuus]|nr:putative 1,4-beta-D-xylan synthase [Helianthus annuus]
MKAHKIIEAVQREQKVQYGIKNPRSLIVVTPTYVRTFQALHLTGLMHTLMNLPYDVVWIVVEAGGATNETAALLAKSKVKVKVMHIGFEKKMPIFWEGRHKVESEMRLKALRVVREEKLDGIVMFADDSNMHSLELFDEIQNVEWIAVDEEDEKKSPLAVQGPACNASDRLSGWHTFNTGVYKGRNANYIGDMAVVLPRKLEWSGFVMNSRLVWKEAEFRPDWIKDLDVVVAGDGEDDIGSPLSLVKDASMVEPLGRCGKKVMLWWLRAEARADSKFPSGLVILLKFSSYNHWMIMIVLFSMCFGLISYLSVTFLSLHMHSVTSEHANNVLNGKPLS